MRERLGSSKYIIALTLRNLGLAYAFVDRPQDAFACFTKAIAIEKQVSSNYQWSTSMTLRSFGLFFHMQGNYNQAIEYLSKAWSEYLKCSELYTEHV
jgi:tetratricopeptide (TPR) repeat protein